MQEIKVRWKGVAPIMFHNERLANPTNEHTRELKKLTSQRKKTDDILEQIKKIEWRAGFYDVNDRVVVPSDNVLATTINGARKLKKGKDVNAGVFAQEAYFPLEYDGPKGFEKLWEDGRFLDYRGVVINRSRCMRARPVFQTWSLIVTLFFDPEIVTESELRQSMKIGGEVIGLCERRPRCGRFFVEEV